MSMYAERRAELIAQRRHFNQHQHCPGCDRGRYHPLYDDRGPHGEGHTTPPRPSPWDAMAQAGEEQGDEL